MGQLCRSPGVFSLAFKCKYRHSISALFTDSMNVEIYHFFWISLEHPEKNFDRVHSCEIFT